MNAASQPASLRTRLGCTLVVALVAGAVDALDVRLEYHHRGPDLALFLESATLWLVFALGALPVSVIADAVLRRRTKDERFDSAARVGARHLAWTALPVVAHSRLDNFTGIGGDTSALRTFAPWIELGLALLALLALTWLLGRLLQSWRPRTTLLASSCVALGLGGTTALRLEDDEPSPGVAGDTRPNILLLVWDTTRAQSLSPFGYDRETTPHLAELTTSATRFTSTRSVSCYTLSSHLSMLTGAYPSHHGARMTRQRFSQSETPTIVRQFREAGYRTGAFVGTDVLRAQSGIGFAFERYDDQVDPWVTYTSGWAFVHDLQSLAAARIPQLASNGLPHWFQDFQRPASDVLRHALEWIESDDPRPWLCFINLYDAHWPYLPEPSALNKWVRPYDGPVDGYAARGDRVVASRHKLDERDGLHLSDLYDAELWDLDAIVDQFLGRLDLGRTAVLMTSDHGEAFGEGGRHEHADILECQVHVPLVLRPAGGGQMGIREEPASGVDVAPTLLALAGLKPAKPMDGFNLLEPFDPVRRVLVEDRDHPNPRHVKLALYDGTWKVVRFGLGSNERWALHDVAADPNEAQDVSAAFPDVFARLKTELLEFRARWGADDEADSRVGPIGNLDALKTLGYTDSE
jgi:arylsulfatase A-like enzyme